MLWGSKKQLTCSCQITIKEIKAFRTTLLTLCFVSDWYSYHFLILWGGNGKKSTKKEGTESKYHPNVYDKKTKVLRNSLT